VHEFGFEPNLDVLEDDKKIYIKAELPGLDEKDIDVTVTPEVLTIRGKKRKTRRKRTMITYTKKPIADSSREASLFPKASIRKRWKPSLKTASLALKSLGWKVQWPGKRLPLKHHK